MKVLYFFIAMIITLGFCFFLGMEKPLGQPLPPIGNFFSPFSGFWQNTGIRDEFTLQSAEFEALQGDVKVIFDNRLVPHIFAENEADAMYVQGYITARYRLWQMDFATRAAAGRLSEVVGPAALPRDIQQRRKGMVRAAENAMAAWEKSSEELKLIQSYTDGINAYIERLSPKEFPLEFKLLNYAPELWSPLKSALMFKNMAETLCYSNSDLEAQNALEFLGKSQFDLLYPDYNSKQSPVIPSGTPWNFEAIQVDTAASSPVMIGDLLNYKLLPESPSGIGSNNWAVSGSKTKSGFPILCNDPHLTLSLPSIWYEVQVHTPEYQAYGVSIPGLPGIVIGFNQEQAWGVTNVGHDVLDWYRMTWMDDAKTTYLVDDKTQKVEIVEEVIRVKGQKTPHLEQVKYTVWGPIVYEDPNSPYRDLAMRWIAHEVQEEKPFYEIGTFLRLGKATSFEEYETALHHYESPAQNFIMANRQGDIAIRVNGKFPLKSKGQGRFIEDGSNSSRAWKQFIPMDQVPAVHNPPQGFVSSANQISTDSTYPYYYHSEKFDEYRGRILNRLLSESKELTTADMMKLQNNNRSILAEEALPLLLKLTEDKSLTQDEFKWKNRLGKWNYEFDKNSLEPILFVEWMDAVHRLAFDELYALPDSIPMLKPRTFRLLELLTNFPEDAVFDIKGTLAKETAANVVQTAFKEAVSKFKENETDPNYNWAKHKGTDIMHLARIPAFSRMDLPVGGYGEALNAIKQTQGPSWRVIVEMGPELRAFGIYPGGQSGHPGSKYYDNRIDAWMKGEYEELFVMKTVKDRSKPVWFEVNFQQKLN
jgi:penicillin amidase